MEKCRGCGKTFARLASHTPHCNSVDKCPGCGEYFARLASHTPHCKGRESPQAENKTVENCLDCGQSFARLASHKPHCKGNGNSQASHKPRSKGKEGPEAVNKPLEKCPGCGQSFTRLASHTPHCKGKETPKTECKTKEKSPDCGQPVSHTQNCKGKETPKAEGKTMEKCSDCGQSFAGLALHTPHCKGKETPKAENKTMEKCPDCGQSFVRLALHTRHCKGKEKPKAEDKTMEKCPDCGQSFVRLALHTRHCKGKEKPKAEGKTMEKCPDCGQSFVRLALHTPHCKGEKKPEVEGKTMETCPKCRQSFARLASHTPHCKGIGSRPGSLLIVQVCDICKKDVQCGMEHECVPQRTTLPDVPEDPTYSCDPKAELENLIETAKLENKEVSEAAQFINDLMEKFAESLNESDIYFQWTIVTSGSFYEKVKVSHPNEFDLMIVMTNRYKAHPDVNFPNYCQLEVPETDRKSMARFLTDQRWLSPKAVKDHIVELMPAVLRGMRSGRRFTLVKPTAKCPAITLKYEKETYYNERPEKVVYDVDLVPSVQVDPSSTGPWLKDVKIKKGQIKNPVLYAVTKAAVVEVKCQPKQDTMWRISFSALEKDIILHADRGEQTCRKTVLKVLKLILEKAKEKHGISSIPSYLIKTFMLHQFDGWPEEHSWAHNLLRTRLLCCIRQLKTVLSQRTLKHYFLRDVHLTDFTQVKDEDIESLRIYLDHWERQI